MKAAFSTLLGLAFVFAAVAAIGAADEKGKVLKGTITCTSATWARKRSA